MAAAADPRIRTLWIRLAVAVGSYVLISSSLVLFFLSLHYIARYWQPEPGAAVPEMPRPTEEEVAALFEDGGVRAGVVLIQVVTGLCMTALLAWILDRRPLASLGLGGRRFRWPVFGWGLFLGAAGSALVVLAIGAIGGRHLRWEVFQDVSPGFVLLIAALVTAAAFMEEWFIRGYVFVNIREGGSPVRAILFTALIFTGLHITQPGSGALGWMNLLLLGVVLGQLRELTGGLAWPMGLRIGWSLTLGMVLGSDLSGWTLPSLLRVSLHDLAAPLGGGDFGPEASIVATVVFLAACGALTYRMLPPPEPDF